MRTALLALIAPALFLAIAEGLTREFITVPRWILFSKAACMQRDRLVGYSFIPHCVGRYGDTPVRTDGLGLRGDDALDDGRRRILAIGDSCTWGFSVREQDSYPAQLQQLLDQRHRETRYRVINAGHPGFTSHHGLLYLRERGLALHPSLVLIGYEWNDSAKLGEVEAKLERIRRFWTLLRVDDWLRVKSSFYRLIAINLGPHTAPELDPQVTPAKYRENVARMVDMARNHGAQVALIEWNVPSSPLLPVLDELSNELSVPLVRFYGPRIPGDLVHPSVEGYRRFVAMLYERLRDAGYIDAS